MAKRSDPGPDQLTWAPLMVFAQEAPDYRIWRKADALPLDDAICYLMSMHPECDRSTWHFTLWERFKQIRRLVMGCIDRSLPTIRIDGGYWVQPSIFLEWAHTKNIDVPKEMELPPAPGSNSKIESSPRPL